MKHKYGEGLIGLKVRLFTNGDITVLDIPGRDIRDNFGPTYGSQCKVYGKIVDFNIDFEHIEEIDVTTVTVIRRGIRVRIWIEYNDYGKLGLHTSGWDFTLEDFKQYIAYVKGTVNQEEE